MIRYKYKGNNLLAETKKRTGTLLYEQLVKSLSFQNLKTGRLQRVLSDGTIITCSIHAGVVASVTIDVEPVEQVKNILKKSIPYEAGSTLTVYVSVIYVNSTYDYTSSITTQDDQYLRIYFKCEKKWEESYSTVTVFRYEHPSNGWQEVTFFPDYEGLEPDELYEAVNTTYGDFYTGLGWNWECIAPGVAWRNYYTYTKVDRSECDLSASLKDSVSAILRRGWRCQAKAEPLTCDDYAVDTFICKGNIEKSIDNSMPIKLPGNEVRLCSVALGPSVWSAKTTVENYWPTYGYEDYQTVNTTYGYDWFPMIGTGLGAYSTYLAINYPGVNIWQIYRTGLINYHNPALVDLWTGCHWSYIGPPLYTTEVCTYSSCNADDSDCIFENCRSAYIIDVGSYIGPYTIPTTYTYTCAYERLFTYDAIIRDESDMHPDSNSVYRPDVTTIHDWDSFSSMGAYDTGPEYVDAYDVTPEGEDTKVYTVRWRFEGGYYTPSFYISVTISNNVITSYSKGTGSLPTVNGTRVLLKYVGQNASVDTTGAGAKMRIIYNMLHSTNLKDANAKALYHHIIDSENIPAEGYLYRIRSPLLEKPSDFVESTTVSLNPTGLQEVTNLGE
jgi:hypothetical protein